MDRREAMTAVGAALTMAALSKVAQAEDSNMAMPHMEMHYQGLIEATSHCVRNGQLCLSHCLFLLGNGDDSMADCSKAVNQMLACCSALQSLASQGSRLVPAMARVALEACTQCEQACRKHADMHAPCKACMESCTECIKQCRAVAA